jgi:excinuclease ABC subunit B
MREHCERENIEVIAEFTDEAISGKTDNRENFQKMISQLLKGHIQADFVLVHKFNRFARNKYDSALYKKKLKDIDIKVAYLHSEVKTLERLKIIQELRMGKYDCVVGINLLREGIDISEVSLICIMDADKQGFLRSSRSLIQTIGRCARNASGHVIMYADTISEAMDVAITETKRRRKIQEDYNKEHGIVPKTIIKEIREVVSNEVKIDDSKNSLTGEVKMSKKEKEQLIIKVENEMKEAAKNLDFEKAMELRDILFELKSE